MVYQGFEIRVDLERQIFRPRCRREWKDTDAIRAFDVHLQVVRYAKLFQQPLDRNTRDSDCSEGHVRHPAAQRGTRSEIVAAQCQVYGIARGSDRSMDARHLTRLQLPGEFLLRPLDHY